MKPLEDKILGYPSIKFLDSFLSFLCYRSNLPHSQHAVIIQPLYFPNPITKCRSSAYHHKAPDVIRQANLLWQKPTDFCELAISYFSPASSHTLSPHILVLIPLSSVDTLPPLCYKNTDEQHLK